jgi:hypothetical protein
MTILTTRELRDGDFVQMTSGHTGYVGRRFLVNYRDLLEPDFIGLCFAKRDGTRDHRYDVGWTGSYPDALWTLLHRPGRKSEIVVDTRNEARA